MKFYGTYLSPYAARVILVARARGHDLVPEHPPGDGPEREAYVRLNPTGKMPLLVDGGFALPESSVIADYIDATLPGAPLWPADPKERASAALLARFVDVWIAPGFSSYSHAIRDDVPGPTRENGWAQFAKGIESVEHFRARDRTWLAGDGFGHADAALLPWLYLIGMSDGETGGWRHIRAHSGLADYWDRARETPLVSAVVAEMAARHELLFGRNGSIKDGPRSIAEAAAITAGAARTS